MLPILPFRAEYATSYSNHCGKCERIIPKNTVLIGILRQSINDCLMMPEWYDMTCFFEIQQPISEDYIDGFANLRYRHQVQILNKLDYYANGASTSEQPPTKKCKFDNLELEKPIEIQNYKFFAVYDKIEEFRKRGGDCWAILKANNQFVPESYAEMLIHLCDVLYFGALAPCPVCKDGKFVFRNTVYCCTGYDSAWSSCTNTVREPKRIPVEIPEKYKETLGTDFEVRTRILRDIKTLNEDELKTTWPTSNTNDPSNLNCNLNLNAEIEITILKEVVLDFVDINLNKNTYVKLQLLQNSYEPSKHIIRESMGRIGTSVGTTNQRGYSTRKSAQDEFNKIYFERTGNQFETSNFVKEPGLYNDVLIDNNEALTIVKLFLQNDLPATKLSKPLYELMKLMCEDDEVFKSTLLEYCFDLDTMPLGKLTKEQIQDAMNILGEISSTLDTGNRQEIIALSNQFYSYFPQNFGHQRPPIIDTCEMVQEKMDMLQNVMQKQLRYEFLISESNQETNLFDLCYAQLENSAEITMLNKSLAIYTQICDYIKNTQLRSDENSPNNNRFYRSPSDPGAFEVDEIFEVSRHEEAIRYAPHESNFNRQLLFHGTPIKNFVSILTNGVKTNTSFGRGIYFSDSVSKSAEDCRSEKSKVGLVLLCEVAVGITDICDDFDGKNLMDRCETVLVRGQYQPGQLHIRPDGLKIPNGMLVQRKEETRMTFNEFIVFDDSLVKIRYIVKLKFN